MTAQPANSLVFLKLGGSLITDKSTPMKLRAGVLDRLCGEIAQVRKRNPDLRLLLGHGSGSFGHVPAKKFRTLNGVHNQQDWLGFQEVWYQASALNRFVMEALRQHDLPAISVPPSAAVSANQRLITQWNLRPIEAALAENLLPVVYGDVIFDQELGGTILSTEDLFVYLAAQLHPTRILLAGQEPGVWADFPDCTELLDEVSPEEMQALQAGIGAARGVDVTGGMADKISQMSALVQNQPGLEVTVFSGLREGTLARVLQGQPAGTIIRLPPVKSDTHSPPDRET